jgi:hypothetical protein
MSRAHEMSQGGGRNEKKCRKIRFECANERIGSSE